jgi:hypothetical protein
MIAGVQQNFFNYTCPTHLRVTAGQNITCNFQSGIIFGQGFAVFVDWNKDCTFAMSEQVCATAGVPAAATPASASFVVPATTLAGAYKMRVRCAYATAGTTIDPCFQYSYGETHDYTLYVGSVCTATLPVCTVLPIELMSFDAVELEHSVEVDWSTASEVNSGYFLVERSEDHQNFSLVQKVEAYGNTHDIKKYGVIDVTPKKTGTVYYRLRQFDRDGIENKSHITSININVKENEIKLMPDPADNYVEVIFPSSLTGKVVTLEVTDATGKKQLARRNVVLDGKSKSITLDVLGLEKGLYFVRIISENSVVGQGRFIRN